MEDTLHRGDSNPAVKSLQSLLKADGSDITVNGIYDARTEAAVRAFQAERGLAPTGEADAKTRALLILVYGKSAAEPAFFGDTDKDGMLTAKDALLLVRGLLTSAGEKELALTDANGDGRLDGKDALFLIKCLFGKDGVRPIREGVTAGTAERSDFVLGLLAALDSETPLRRALVTEALSFAYDPLTEPIRPFPRSLYLWGANLYTESLALFCPAPKDIELGALENPAYFDAGRREMMLRAIAEGGGTLTAADCSGAIAGLWRKYGLCAPDFDATANELMTMGTAITSAALRPGDVVGFPGHIGLYAGSGAVIEWVGGAYGCQLTRLSCRQCWSFTEQKLITMQKNFTSFTRPACLP